MRAKKKNKINFERKEKIIHKETMRFLSLLEMHTSNTLTKQPYFPELYDNIVNHLRGYISQDNFAESDIRDYLNDEHTKIKNNSISNNVSNEDNQNDSIQIDEKEEEYTRTIFDIETLSNETDNIAENHLKNDLISSSEHSNQLIKKENGTQEEKPISALKKLREEKFSNLQVLEINSNDESNFVTLSEEPFLKKILVKKGKLKIFRQLKYIYLKWKRS